MFYIEACVVRVAKCLIYHTQKVLCLTNVFMSMRRENFTITYIYIYEYNVIHIMHRRDLSEGGP